MWDRIMDAIIEAYDGDEDPVEFAGVVENLVDKFQPQGLLEEQLVERAAVCMWRLRRLYGIEAGIFHFEIATIERHNASKNWQGAACNS